MKPTTLADEASSDPMFSLIIVRVATQNLLRAFTVFLIKIHVVSTGTIQRSQILACYSKSEKRFHLGCNGALKANITIYHNGVGLELSHWGYWIFSIVSVPKMEREIFSFDEI